MATVKVEEDTVVRVATTKEEEDTVVVITEEGAGITEEEATEVDTTMAATKEEEATEVDTIMATTKEEEEEALMEEADI